MQILENIFNGSTINIMLDLETLGTTPGCKVLSIGLAHFTEDGVISSEEIIPKLTGQVGHEDAATFDWWLEQSDEAQSIFGRNIEEGVPISTCADKMRHFISQAKKYSGIEPGAECRVNIWGNGSSFDNVILASLFRDHGYDVPWNTFGDRCYRTAMKMLGPVNIQRTGVYHNAVDDAEYQALCLIAALKNAGK